ncbi:MAG TPA: zf-HC2 domain-containing protein [Longimicrobiales bacterium]|nr:zf-HC2 domain-containing protein [Longimicrobiales bacterium]
MTCSEFIEGFSDYIDGEGEPAALEAARAHVEGCAECRRYEAVYSRGVALLRSFPEVAVSDGFEPELEVRLRRDTAAALRRLDTRPPASGSAMAVVFGMAVILVGAAWAPFLFTRPLQVELAPIVAAYPTRALQARMPEIRLLPARAGRGGAVFSTAQLWEEPSALLRQYAPVMRGYYQTAGTVRVGLD